MTRLFSRRCNGKRLREFQRIKALAHTILDRVASGHDVDEAEIDWALRITGDLE